MPTPYDAESVTYAVRVDPGHPMEPTPLGVWLDVPLTANTAERTGSIRVAVDGIDQAAHADIHAVLEVMAEAARAYVQTVADRYSMPVDATRVYHATAHPEGDPWPAPAPEEA